MEGSPFVCQTHAFIFLCYLVYTVGTARKHIHTFNSFTKQLHSCNFLFCSCHLSVRFSARTHPGEKNTYKNTECKGKCTYSISQILTWTAIILSPLSSWHLTDNDVIVSSRGGLPLIEVGASARARVAICPKHRLAIAGIVWPIRQAVKCSSPLSPPLSLSWLSAALCSRYNNGNVGLWRSQMPEVKPACWHECFVS